MKQYFRMYKWMVAVLLFCLFLFGCSKPREEKKEQKDKTVSEIFIPGLLEYCVDAFGEYYYYTVSGKSVIYQCAMDGTPVAQFEIMADATQPEKYDYTEEQATSVADLSGLCISGNMMYCYRGIKGSLMAVDITTGENRLLSTQDIFYIYKMDAGDTTIMLQTATEEGKELYVYHTDTAVMERVQVECPEAFAIATGDTYWVNVKAEENAYGFQEYHADTGTFGELYESNFTYELAEMTYDKNAGLMYGRMYSVQYLCFAPTEPKAVSRFMAQQIYQSPACFRFAGGRLYIQDVEQGIVYHFDPAAYVTWNEPLKGYVTSELSVTEWAGYNIDLEVIDWEELALKVLAEDRDYDFVIMTTDMAEAVALRNAMAYLPISEDAIKNYWAECWPCIKQGASYNGDIWMLPLEVYARGLIYSEQNLAKYGLSIENMKTVPDLCEVAKTLHANGEIGWYNLQPMQDYLLQEYLWKQQKEVTINFDTPEFRSIMEFIREEYKDNDYSNAYYRNSYINLNSWGPYDETSLLTYAEQKEAERRRQAAKVFFNETGDYSAEQYVSYIGAEGIRVGKVPGMFGTEEMVQVNGTFLVLNPNSENKEELLDFVAAMSETYIANPDNFLSSYTERYVSDPVMQDVCDLYRNGEMVFGMPEGLFSNYYRYVMGQDLNPDEVVKELNRVVNMYYGE